MEINLILIREMKFLWIQFTVAKFKDKEVSCLACFRYYAMSSASLFTIGCLDKFRERELDGFYTNKSTK